MDNLELYGGPGDGHLMMMPTFPKEGGGLRRPGVLTIFEEVYSIEPISKHPDKNPCLGVTHIGVHRAKRN
jgi:hypothetical protein